MSGIDAQQLAELEAAIEADPGHPDFPALAELHRRAGRLEDAERVVRQGLERKSDLAEGRLILALILLEHGCQAEARSELERLTPDVLAASGIPVEQPATAALSDSELEVAFQQAETDAEQLITPNRVAEEAVAQIDAAAAEGLDEGVLPEALEPGSAFATATMAELLERQGDESGAERIRASLDSEPPQEASPGGSAGTEKQIATLERWLASLRGDRS